MKLKLINLFIFLFVLITIPSVSQWLTISIGNTTIWWTVYLTMLLLMLKWSKDYLWSTHEKYFLFVTVYLLWNFTCIIRGFFVAENYWEWKNLVNTGMFMLMPLAAFLGSDKTKIPFIIRNWLIFMLPAFFLFLPFVSQADAVGRYLVPVLLLALFFPVLPQKWKIIVLFFLLIVLLAGLDARSNVLRFGVAFILGISYYFKKIIPNWSIKLAHLSFILMPFLFLLLAITGHFNVFKMHEYLGKEFTAASSNDGERETNLTADSRTFIYVEAISSAVKNNYAVFGRTPARGYDSEWFGDHQYRELGTGKMERFGSEVGILNIFTWAGVVGVFLNFLIFFTSSYMAVYRSQNFFMKILGLFIAFRWMFSFVEEFSRFDLSNIMLWFMIGMCYSTDFRSMNNRNFIIWIRSLVSKKYQFQLTEKIINKL